MTEGDLGQLMSESPAFIEYAKKIPPSHVTFAISGNPSAFFTQGNNVTFGMPAASYISSCYSHYTTVAKTGS